MECIITGIEILPQIPGMGQEVIGVKIAVVVDNTLPIKADSFIIVDASIIFSSSPDVIKIAQVLSSSNIIKGSGTNPDILNLDGTLWMLKNVEVMEIVDSTVNIYYVKSD